MMRKIFATFMILVGIAGIVYLTGCQEAKEPTTVTEETQPLQVGPEGEAVIAGAATETAQQRLERLKREYAARQKAAAKPKPRRGDAGHLTVDKLNYDFGEVSPMEKVRGRFKLTNDGKETIKFKVGKSCGCTVPQIKTDTLKPGESAPLDIIFTAPTHPGKTSKSLWADVEPPGQPAKLTMTISANVREIIQFEPKRLSFKLDEAELASVPLVITSTDDTPFKITGYSVAFQALTVEYDKELEATRHELIVKPNPDNLRKANNRTLFVNIGHPKLRQISVPFTVTKPFSAYPETRAFLNIKPGQPSKATITIVSNFDESFELGDVTSDQGLVQVLETAKQDKGYVLTVEMTPPDDANKMYFNDSLNIAIKDHPKDTLKVRCYGRVRR